MRSNAPSTSDAARTGLDMNSDRLPRCPPAALSVTHASGARPARSSTVPVASRARVTSHSARGRGSTARQSPGVYSGERSLAWRTSGTPVVDSEFAGARRRSAVATSRCRTSASASAAVSGLLTVTVATAG